MGSKHKMKKSFNSLHLTAVAAAVVMALPVLAQASDQSDSKGFVADSSLNILNRNRTVVVAIPATGTRR
jgi:imipenem/basic amino acid-specific outer membrane pore